LGNRTNPMKELQSDKKRGKKKGHQKKMQVRLGKRVGLGVRERMDKTCR